MALEPNFDGIRSQMAGDLWIAPPGRTPAERVLRSEAFAGFAKAVGKVITDSGCKLNVAEEMWHHEAQKWLVAQGLRAQEGARVGKFRFGDGRLVKATPVWKSRGRLNPEYRRNLEDCTPLRCVSSMQQRGLVLDIRNQNISLVYRTERMTLLSN